MDPSVLLSVSACLLAILLKWWFSPRTKLPPGPIGLPVVGYLPFLSRKPYLDFYRLAKKYGYTYSLRLGGRLAVVLNDFDSTKEAFNNDAFGGRPPEIPSALNKETLETDAFYGLPWKNQRRFALHMLRDLGVGKTKLEEHEEISELLEELEKHVGKPYCIFDLLAPSMSNNIASMVFGRRFKYSDPTRKMMTRIIVESLAIAGRGQWTGLIFFPWVRKVVKYFGIVQFDKLPAIQRELRDFMMKEIEEHEKTLDPNNIRDFIDGYLVEMANRKGDPTFCKAVLQDLGLFFFKAGSETGRVTVEWLLLAAAAHPEAQRRVQREIDDGIGSSQFPNWAHQKSMPYTEAFISEMGRWRTVVPLNILRYALKDGEIGGYSIPKGTILFNNLWAIHNDPEYWGRDADEFRPERFLTDDGLKVKKWDHFAPFSVGKRACPGESLAKVEVFLYFASILQRFDVRLPEGKTVDFEGILGITLRPKKQELIFAKRN